MNITSECETYDAQKRIHHHLRVEMKMELQMQLNVAIFDPLTLCKMNFFGFILLNLRYHKTNEYNIFFVWYNVTYVSHSSASMQSIFIMLFATNLYPFLMHSCTFATNIFQTDFKLTKYFDSLPIFYFSSLCLCSINSPLSGIYLSNGIHCIYNMNLLTMSSTIVTIIQKWFFGFQSRMLHKYVLTVKPQSEFIQAYN